MAKKKVKTYRVEIVEIKTDKIEAVIGHGLTEEQAERRVITGVSRINTDTHYVREIEE